MALLKNVSATILTTLFFVSQCVLAHSAETNFWGERQKNIQQINNAPMLASLPASMMSNPAHMLNTIPLPALSITSSSVSKKVKNSLSASQTKILSPLFEALSSPYGTIRQVSLPSKLTANTKTIIHIQDVHQNSEAQQNIAQAVQKLIDSGKADLVALEGAFDVIDLTALREFPNPQATTMVADYLLREHRITGPVYAGLTSRSPIPVFVGVDDHAGYHANVDAYLQSTPQRDAQKRAIAQQKSQASEQKEKLFNAALKEFDNQAASYHAGVLPMGDYVRVLMKEEPGSLQLNLFHETYELESRLNFSQVEAERNRVIAQLLEKLSKEETSALVNHSIAYRLGNLNHTDFYEYLSSICSKKGVVLSSYPAMKAYIQYVLMSDGIHPDTLMKDMATQEARLYNKLIQTNEERVLVGQLQTMRLQEKLLDFALTPEEWEAYKARRHGHEHEAWKNISLHAHAHAKNLSSFERFYLEAERRNQSIADNLLKAMQRHQSSVAVLVTGGFHTAGIDALLKSDNIATLTFVPTITKVDDENGSSYLSVFAREKTPLDRLFAGEKLFVTQNPAQLGGASAMQGAVETHLKSGANDVTVPVKNGYLSMLFAAGAIESVKWMPELPAGIQLKPLLLMHEGLFDDRVFSLFDTGFDVLDTALSFLGFLAVFLIVVGLVFLVAKIVTAKWKNLRPHKTRMDFWIIFALAIFLINSDVAWASEQVANMEGAASVSTFSFGLLFGFVFLASLYGVNRWLSEKNIQSRVKKIMNHRGPGGVAIIAHDRSKEIISTSRWIPNYRNKYTFLSLYSENGMGPFVSDVLVQDGQGVKHANSLEEAYLKNVLSPGQATAKAWSEIVTRADHVLVLGPTLGVSAVSEKSSVLWARTPIEVRWVQEALQDWRNHDYAEIQYKDLARDIANAIIDPRNNLAALQGSIGTLGIDGKENASFYFSIQEANRIIGYLKDELTQLKEVGRKTPIMNRDEAMLLAYSLAHVLGQDAAEKEIRFSLPSRQVDPHGFETALDHLSKILNVTHNRRIVFDVDTEDMPIVMAQSWDDDNYMYLPRKEKLSGDQLKDISAVVTRLLLTEKREVGQTDQDLLKNWLVILPTGSHGFDRIAENLRDHLQFLEIDQLLAGSAKSVNVAIMLEIYRMLQQHA